MEINWVEFTIASIAVVTNIVVVARAWEKQDARITLLESVTMSKIDKLDGKLVSTNKDINKLEERVSNHKEKWEDKFNVWESRMDARDTIINKKIDDLKDLIIDRLPKQ